MRRLLSVLILLIGAAFARQAMAFATEGGLVWPNSTTTFNYFLTAGTLLESTDLGLAQNDWNSAQPYFKFVSSGNATDPCDQTQPNGASLDFSACGEAFGSNVLAITMYTSNSRHFFTHAGIVFNRNVQFGDYDGPLRSTSIDFRRVAIHELGHVLGLDHETDPTIPAIMAPDVSDIDRPTADDIAGVKFLYGSLTGGQTTIVSAVLPASRSVQVGASATVFASIANAGAQPATGCSIGLASAIPATVGYQTTSAATNQASGSPNVPADIPVGKSQSFIITLTPAAAIPATDVAFNMQCATAPAAANTVGLNTLLLSASNVPAPDVVALAATIQNDGYVHVGFNQGSGAFAVATVNLGAGAAIVASADTGATVLPLTVNLCQTNPVTGQCISPIAPSVQTNIATNGTPTFGVFLSSTATIAPDPANKRIFVRFRDAGGVTRGSTSVAVTSLQ